tara:strand:- start:52 stop:276 length:225 start_codon:yes stop_codon:yes gene_type:complete
MNKKNTIRNLIISDCDYLDLISYFRAKETNNNFKEAQKKVDDLADFLNAKRESSSHKLTGKKLYDITYKTKGVN